MADFPEIVKGTTLVLGIRDPEAGAEATCIYAVRGAGTRAEASARRVGDEWEATFAASATTSWPKGTYEFQALRTDGAEVELVDSGRFELVENFTDSDAARIASQSFAEAALECVEQAILDYAGDGAVSVSVGDQSYSFESRLDLLAFRERLREEVARERRGPTVRSYRWRPS